VQALREAIADKTEELYGYKPDAGSDITVTAGATEALYAPSPRWCVKAMKSSALIQL
jgi:aspartate/methionine/tyrosine aminotransferase